jgi:hypothetical protein
LPGYKTAMPTARLQPILLLLALVLITGCASRAPLPDWPARQHVIAVDEKGQTIDPSKPWPAPESIDDYDRQLDDMFAAMEQWHAQRLREHPGEPARILLYVHGGLTSPDDAYRSSVDKAQKIMDAGYWPIFIVWNSDLGSSYAEHLIDIRQGRYAPQWAWLAPIYLFADLGRAVARFPIVWSFQASADISRSQGTFSSLDHHDAERRWLDNPQFASTILITDGLLKQYQQDPAHSIQISMGAASGDPWKASDYALTYVLFYPVKFLCAPILDGTGTAAWDNMYRRAMVLFDGFSAANLNVKPDDVRQIIDPGEGPLVRLMRHLKRASSTRRDPKRASAGTQSHPDLPSTTRSSESSAPCSITLVGHSMGTIVLDELIRRSIEQNVRYDNIIYMAAAASVRDFQRSVIPYLQRNRTTNFYNLCLHPVNEVRERHAADIVPRGSLLVWVDEMYSDPHTPLDRTLGRWENVVAAAYAIPRDVAPRVHLKAFACQISPPVPPGLPQMHGDFSGAPFWDPNFWQVSTPAEEAHQNAPVRQKADQIRTRRARSTTRPVQAPRKQTEPSAR